MRMSKTAIVICLLVAAHKSEADDAVWRSSRPLKVVSKSGATTVRNAGTTRFIWERIEYPLLVQGLQLQIEEAREDSEFWALRLENYERLRFTDATQTAIRHAENSYAASCRREQYLRRQLDLLRLNRVILGRSRYALPLGETLNSRPQR